MLELFARIGYASRGIVYLILGALATGVALDLGGRVTGTSGALEPLAQEPIGRALLIMLACGLICFAVWRSVEAVADLDRLGRSARGLLTRAGFLATAALYAALAYFTVRLLLTGQGGETGEEQAAREWTALLLAQPVGPLLVGIVGGIIAAAGLGIAYYGWVLDFCVEMRIRPGVRVWVVPLCRFGLVARGVVSVLIGACLIVAAWQYDPGEARGIAGALLMVRTQPYGGLPFAIAALGLLAFGIFGLIEALYRRVGVSA